MALRKGIARRRALRIGHQMPGKSARSDHRMPDEIWGQCQIGPSDGNHRRPQMAINAREDTSPLTWYGSLRVLIEGFGPMGNGSRAVITLRGVPVRASSVATCMQLGGTGAHHNAIGSGSSSVGVRGTQRSLRRPSRRALREALREALRGCSKRHSKGNQGHSSVRNGRQGCSPRKAQSLRRGTFRALRAIDEG